MAKVSRKTKQEEAHRPHVGTFITMTVGLLLFFGSLSQIGKLTDTKDLLSAQQTDEEIADDGQASQLMHLREEAVAVIGGQTTRPTYYQDEVEAAPLPVTPQPNPFGQYGSSGQNQNTQPSTPTGQTQPQNQQQRVRPVEPTATASRVYSVKENDTLYRIAKMCYGDGNKWTLIRDANPQVNPAALRPGQNLVIPQLPQMRPEGELGQTAYSGYSNR